jgi:hypothetical protein
VKEHWGYTGRREKTHGNGIDRLALRFQRGPRCWAGGPNWLQASVIQHAHLSLDGGNPTALATASGLAKLPGFSFDGEYSTMAWGGQIGNRSGYRNKYI